MYVSVREGIMAITDKFLGFKIKDIMTPSLIHFNDTQNLNEAIDVFMERRISGAPVKNEKGEYCGVLSKTDLLKKDVIEAFKAGDDTVTVADIMKYSELVTINQGEVVENAAEIMLHHGIHRIFVTDESDSVVGVLSSYDVMKVLATFSDIHAIEKKLNVRF